MWSHLHSIGGQEKVRKADRARRRRQYSLKAWVCSVPPPPAQTKNVCLGKVLQTKMKEQLPCRPMLLSRLFKSRWIFFLQFVLWFSEPRNVVVLIKYFFGFCLYYKSSSPPPWSLLFPVLSLTSGKGFGIWDLEGIISMHPLCSLLQVDLSNSLSFLFMSVWIRLFLQCQEWNPGSHSFWDPFNSYLLNPDMLKVVRMHTHGERQKRDTDSETERDFKELAHSVTGKAETCSSQR